MDRPRVTELKVSGHLMRLESGLYCVFHSTAGPVDPASGLPGVRVSLPPGSGAGGGAVEIGGFRSDGWVSAGRDAILIRVNEGPAEVLVTVYQACGRAAGAPPRLKVVRIDAPDIASPKGHVPTADADLALAPAPSEADPPTLCVRVHVQGSGDVTAPFGAWVGARGSGRWIEGFELIAPRGLAEEDIEYRAILGREWTTPWTHAGRFCGSRGFALPLLGFVVRLKGTAPSRFECAYLASFTDGSFVGPLASGERCAAANLAPLEALRIILRPRRGARAADPAPSDHASHPPESVAAPQRPAELRLAPRA